MGVGHGLRFAPPCGTQTFRSDFNTAANCSGLGNTKPQVGQQNLGCCMSFSRLGG
jgi:hypothetical protein